MERVENIHEKEKEKRKENKEIEKRKDEALLNYPWKEGEKYTRK